MNDPNILSATVHVPGTIGNLGPGFDTLGAAVEGLGDIVTVNLCPTDQPNRVITSGRGAEKVPSDYRMNLAYQAALHVLHLSKRNFSIQIDVVRLLPFAGGLGGSAAAAVGGALATVYALRKLKADNASMALTISEIDLVIKAALQAETTKGSNHLDNIAPALLGGVCLCINFVAKRLCKDTAFWVSLLIPRHEIATTFARSVLPSEVTRQTMTAQISYASGVTAAILTGDPSLMRHALNDVFAEPARAPLVPFFESVKRAAMRSGALGASLSGAGPSIFALSTNATQAGAIAEAMAAALPEQVDLCFVGRLGGKGAQVLNNMNSLTEAFQDSLKDSSGRDKKF